MGKKIDLTGQRFNRLLIVEEVGRRNGSVTWKCLCDCNNEIVVRGDLLRCGDTQSCGCLQKEKVSKTNKTRLGENHPLFGKHHSKETREKISKIRIGKLKENSPNWNPNLTDEERGSRRIYLEYKIWRRSVYKRDSYTCQVCGDSKGGNLVAHHLDNYKNNIELRTILSNGVTMCTKCHNDFHHQYGYNCIKEQYEEFLKENINEIIIS